MWSQQHEIPFSTPSTFKRVPLTTNKASRTAISWKPNTWIVEVAESPCSAICYRITVSRIQLKVTIEGIAKTIEPVVFQDIEQIDFARKTLGVKATIVDIPMTHHII
jgi:hypothetical protein